MFLFSTSLNSYIDHYCSVHCFSDDVVDEKIEPMIVDSLDSLMGNFRTQQVFVSSSMLNESRKLGLPKKLAVAEVEEAEERSAKGNKKWKCGFINAGWYILKTK